MTTTIERLYEGVYACPSCEIEYAVDRATEDDLFCEECGGDLVGVDEDEDQDDELDDEAA